jgi:hypothetical protein
MTTSALEAVSQLLSVPEGAIPEGGIAIVAYMTPDGKQAVQYGFLGEDSSLFSTIGYLETIKSYLAAMALE